jgi:pyruvate formate lyase activating enzyme
MRGTIIDVKRFTLHDGPGIRSTLFLKGCPLRCAWCQNPEGLETRPKLWYLGRQCVRCRACESVCPADALTVGGEGPFVVVNHARCTACGACVEACPTGALAFDGQELSAEAAADLLLRDREFYAQSGGGITISGGDPLAQPDFALEVLSRCRAAGVSTAIETCLFGDPAVLERFLHLVDLFIVDLKLHDPDMHEEYTGMPNVPILANYAWLAGKGAPILTRIPLIPGITATKANIGALAAFIQGASPGARVELMNYNPLAVNKYALMNRSTEFFDRMAALPEAEVEALRRVLEGAGLVAVRETRRGSATGGGGR